MPSWAWLGSASVVGVGELEDYFETYFIASTIYNLLFKCLSTLFLVSWHTQWSKVSGPVWCLISWRWFCVLHTEMQWESFWLPPLAFKCLLSEILIRSANFLWIKAAEMGVQVLKRLKYATCICYLVSELDWYITNQYPSQCKPCFSLRSCFLPYTYII